MKNLDVVKIYKVLSSFASEQDKRVFGKMFLYKRSLILKEIDPDVEAIKIFETPLSDLEKEYNQKRAEIILAKCVKDDAGNPKVENSEYVFENDDVKLSVIEDTNNLLMEYREPIEKETNELNTFYDRDAINIDETKIRLFTIDDLPESLMGYEFEVLSSLLKD